MTEGLGNADVCPVYAGTCDELDGNHFLAPDQIVLELIDPDSGDVLEWDDGAEGELVATHIDRDCVPLVRFRTRDRVVIRTAPCPCGRTAPRIRCVGRTDDMLIVAGVNVWPSAVTDVVMQLHPRTTGAMQILLLAAAEGGAAAEAAGRVWELRDGSRAAQARAGGADPRQADREVQRGAGRTRHAAAV